MVMKICPKWKMDSAAELAVKNWHVQKKSKKHPLTVSKITDGVINNPPPGVPRGTPPRTPGEIPRGTPGNTLGGLYPSWGQAWVSPN